MKHLVIIIAAMLGIGMMSCSTSKLSNEEKAARNERKSEYVYNSLTRKHFQIEVDQVTPYRGMSRNVSYGYSFGLKGDTVCSYLPYFGRAYQLPFGGGKGLNFESQLGGYTITKNEKKQLYRIHIATQNEEDIYEYIVDMFDNGRSHIEVRCRNREPISFDGMLSFPSDL